MLSFIHPLLHQAMQRLSPCVLCGIDHQRHHSLCTDCWQQLPWLKQNIQRQEMQIQVACHYAYPMDRIIQKFKYEQQLHFQNLLAGSLIDLKLPKIQAIVPMPISSQRLAERGYNQSLVLAKILAKQLKIPVWQPVARLAQHSQKGLSRIERLDQIEQQFVIATKTRVRYRTVLMLDDVVTTGSSLHALKQKLEQLGCQKIYAACIASAEI
ncbi:ComF family protein [Acinetobacter sp. C_4_1]|uniref:ComF family protein n=1 Tax=unclassified Acinetobacter TaxID=196816 RepID=UPI0021B83F4E|nr:MULTISPECIES: phosphoribosyltransferase family protein [unclassified Acinetobacter]MCT8090037.1 ComF family protein [Acinetobacter sp. F_3_1]MCT8098427.1 ComF family protein [Acinetobacter sp. C_3_1]MCT8101495.1 ComF family protein [Acinetobacter sp. C_4_1]MCT8135478.1 ComF family protein [Acinetobacter sp. T_3_1]